MKSLVVVLMLFAGNFAFADANTVAYGKQLCGVVTFTKSVKQSCEAWVDQNSEKNPYTIATGVCGSFNAGPASRTADCYSRAASGLDNQEIKDQTELCAARNGNYTPRAKCMHLLFLNTELAELRRIRAQLIQSHESSATAAQN